MSLVSHIICWDYSGKNWAEFLLKWLTYCSLCVFDGRWLECGLVLNIGWFAIPLSCVILSSVSFAALAVEVCSVMPLRFASEPLFFWMMAGGLTCVFLGFCSKKKPSGKFYWP